jgi:hypothetical protein
MCLRFTYLILLLIIGLNSCKNSAGKPSELTLNPSGKILSFPIDSTTSNISTGLVSYENYLINVNWKTNSLQFFDMVNQKLAKEIFYQYEGPQGVGPLFGVHIESLDSIFLFPQISNLITLTDTSGQILKRIEYKNPETHTNAFVHNTYFLSPPLFYKHKLLVKTHVQGNYRAMTEEILSTSKLGYYIVLSDSSVQSLALNYPEGYLKQGLRHFEASLSFQPDYTVFSLFGDHRIFKQSHEGELEFFEGRSQFLDESLPLFPTNGERFETQKYLMSSSRYESLIFDPYRQIYYRFAYPTLSIEREEELIELRENPGPFVIQVFSKDLGLLTEKYFDSGIYFPNNSFITKNGLYISINNPSNPLANEDALQFELIELTRCASLN